MFLCHEALKSLQSLLKRRRLARLQAGEVQRLLESAVVERAIRPLLLQSKLPQNSRHDMQIERYSSALNGTGGHKVEHALGVEVGLSDSELLHRHIGQLAVDSLHNS